MSMLGGENKFFVISPSHINTKQRFFGVFESTDTDMSARVLVRFAQSVGDWKSFTKDEIDVFCEEDFCFGGLDESKHILKSENGSYSFTLEFIVECFTASPNVAMIKNNTGVSEQDKVGAKLITIYDLKPEIEKLQTLLNDFSPNTVTENAFEKYTATKRQIQNIHRMMTVYLSCR